MGIEETTLRLNGIAVPVYSLDTVVIGSGAAGYNALDWLYDFGRRNIAMITEGVKMGTSRNTGSDKQTYYKLSLNAEDLDSVGNFARTLFGGRGVNGDIALTEAACSVRSFIKLANLGVPFPTNEYGVYVGYKTDNDPMRRASSAGPLTSRFMTERLERSVMKKGIPIFDHMQAIKILTRDGRVRGVLAIDVEGAESEHFGATLYSCNNIIMATGGPSGIYADSAYPPSQTGMSGMALEAGADAVNLTEGQFLMAALRHKWAVSGTYQQVLPRYITMDRNGGEREFLADYFDDPAKLLKMTFLKGYQYPFDVERVPGSSLIDLIIHHEIADKGNRVYLDFRHDPQALSRGFEILDSESYEYLKNSNALVPRPIERLAIMNPRAIEHFAEWGIDLHREPLEVAICAQHCNGGIDVDINWQSTIRGLYVAGEAAGTFGVSRPGGSALNSSQVGSLRAAEHIAAGSAESAPDWEIFAVTVKEQVDELLGKLCAMLLRPAKKSNVMDIWNEKRRRMSNICAHIRKRDELDAFYDDLRRTLTSFFDIAELAGRRDILSFFKARDALIVQSAVVSAARAACDSFGSRGSGMVVADDGKSVHPKLPYRMIPTRDGYDSQQIVTRRGELGFETWFRPVRPLPESENWFETAWKAFNERNERLQF
jgi:succinate dehydrogenase/fumarate reductase flavoprotein subunit